MQLRTKLEIATDEAKRLNRLIQQLQQNADLRYRASEKQLLGIAEIIALVVHQGFGTSAGELRSLNSLSTQPPWAAWR